MLIFSFLILSFKALYVANLAQQLQSENLNRMLSSILHVVRHNKMGKKANLSLY